MPSEKQKLKVEYVDPKTLIPDPENPRTAPTSAILKLVEAAKKFKETGKIEVS